MPLAVPVWLCQRLALHKFMWCLVLFGFSWPCRAVIITLFTHAWRHRAWFYCFNAKPFPVTLPLSAQSRQGQTCVAQLCQQGEAKSPTHLLCRQSPDKAHLFTLAQHQLSRWPFPPHPTVAALAVHTNLPSSVCSSQGCRCSRADVSNPVQHLATTTVAG